MVTGNQDAGRAQGNRAPAANYEVGHTAVVLAYSKDNLAHVIYPVGVSAEDWSHDLPFLPSESWTSP
jgi:hypothetical protein